MYYQFDGGGIRGIIPAITLAEIENQTGCSIAKSFDLIVGTSTGGILALGLSKQGNSGMQEEYSAQDLAGIYADRGKEIFPRSFWKGLSSVGGLSDEKYSHEGLEKGSLRSILEKHCLIRLTLQPEL